MKILLNKSEKKILKYSALMGFGYVLGKNLPNSTEIFNAISERQKKLKKQENIPVDVMGDKIGFNK